MSNCDWLQEGLGTGRVKLKEEERKVENRTGMAKW